MLLCFQIGANRPAQARRQGEKRQALARPAGGAEDTGLGAALDGGATADAGQVPRSGGRRGAAPKDKATGIDASMPTFDATKKGEPKLPRSQTQPLSARDKMFDPPTTK